MKDALERAMGACARCGEVPTSALKLVAAMWSAAEQGVRQQRAEQPSVLLAANHLLEVMGSYTFRNAHLHPFVEAVMATVPKPESACDDIIATPTAQPKHDIMKTEFPVLPAAAETASAPAPSFASGKAIISVPQGQNCAANPEAETVSKLPIRIPPGKSKLNHVAWEQTLRASVLDKFCINADNRQVAIGDLQIGSLERLMKQSGRNAFIASREFNLLRSIHEIVKSTAAWMPPETLIRNILSAEEAEALINKAQITTEGIDKILLPKMLEASSAAA